MKTLQFKVTKEVPPSISIRGISSSQLPQQQQQFLSNVEQQQIQISFDPIEATVEMQREKPIMMLGSPNQDIQSQQQQPIRFEQALGYLNKIKV